MSYEIKKIEEDKDLAAFLLDPFEKFAYMNNNIIQKYTRCSGVDDFVYLDMCNNRFYKIGFILYEKQAIIVGNPDVLDSDVMNKEPFISIQKLKDDVRDIVRKRLDELRIEKMEELKKTRKYVEFKKGHMEKNYEKMFYSKMKGTYESRLVNVKGIGSIFTFVNNLKYEDIVFASLGSMKIIDQFLNDFISDNTMIMISILMPEIEKEVDDYIAAGKFTKREQIFIDYLAVEKASTARRVNVETLSGETYTCWNELSDSGQFLTSGDINVIIDIEDVKSISDGDVVIYQKK